MIRTLLVVLTLVLLSACGASLPELRDPGDAGERLARIEQRIENGDHAAAAELLEQLARDEPGQAGELHLRAAEAWLEAGHPERASTLIESLEIEQLQASGLVRLDLVQAELALLRHDLANAGWLLASTAGHLPPELVPRHEQLETRLAALHAEPVRGALSALEDALQEADFSGELALALLLDFPTIELKGALRHRAEQPELLPWLDLVLGAREHLLDDEALDQELQAWGRRWPDVDFSPDEARDWIAAWRHSQPLPAQVSVLLPDPHSRLFRPGIALRDGLLAQWLQLSPDRRPRLNFRYLDESPEAVIAAWFDAREDGTDFIIGPLEQTQVELLLELPDAGTIPTLLLNLPDDPAQLLSHGGELTALALPPEIEAEQAALHALAQGRRRALVLHQDSDWGERVSQAFSSAFVLGGGQIVAAHSYDPARPDHSARLREALEINRSETRIRRVAGLVGEIRSEARRRSDLDVLFIGAQAADGRLLLPQLRFFDADDLMILATSHLVDGAPRPERDGDLDQVLLPMPPWFLGFTGAGALRERQQPLYDQLDNATLSRLHAMGRDAMAVMPWLAMMRNDPMLSLPGMLGQLSLPDGRVLQRSLPMVRLQNGLARPESLP